MYDSFATDRLIELWLAEDIGACDLTVQTMIAPEATGRFRMNAREPMILAGIAVAARVFKRYDPELDIALRVGDGDRVEAGAILSAPRSTSPSGSAASPPRPPAMLRPLRAPRRA